MSIRWKLALLIVSALPAQACDEPRNPDGYAVGLVDSVRLGDGDAAYYLVRVLESRPPLADSIAEFVTPLIVNRETYVHRGTGRPRHRVASSDWLFPDFEVSTIGMAPGMPVLVTYHVLPDGRNAVAERFVLWDDALPEAHSAKEGAANAEAITNRLLSEPPAEWGFMLVDPGDEAAMILARAEGALAHPESREVWIAGRGSSGRPRLTIREFRSAWAAAHR
jgi:hypothetical protein